jgi:hypothetical protein
MGEKRGSSVTQQMLTERAARLGAEEEASGQPSIWRNAYHLRRCPGSPCISGPHCWRDPVGQKTLQVDNPLLQEHYQVCDEGNRLDTHDDVPDNVRQQL